MSLRSRLTRMIFLSLCGLSVHCSSNEPSRDVTDATSEASLSPPSFNGVKTAVRVGPEITVTWDPASDLQTSSTRMIYRVHSGVTPSTLYLALPIVTPAGATRVQFSDPSLSLSYVTVRAMDEDGNEDNNIVIKKIEEFSDASAPMDATFDGSNDAETWDETLNDALVEDALLVDSNDSSTDSPPSHGCADPLVPTPAQTYPGDIMYGCPGTTTFPGKQALCAPGFCACSIEEYLTYRKKTPPSYNYWTSPALNASGEESSCAAVYPPQGNSCPSEEPMRVCAGTMDALGNTCSWANCRFGSGTTNQNLGGCAGNSTAGTLCCRRSKPCAP